jgi:hypothetical protein
MERASAMILLVPTPTSAGHLGQRRHAEDLPINATVAD